ncbi:hypothetical protein CP533_3529 [Ophiocordyceps camponoti-saundersi (nom. inval.)]|nr:hypothetical protein CP533_3529 [Ophiocordyceps camponoti-saundersi (nom. inval.)]
MPRFFHDAFADLDTSLEAEGIQLLKCEPNYRLWFSDGETLDLSTHLSKLKTEIERYEGETGFHRFLSFLREAHAHYELSIQLVLRRNFSSLLAMARPQLVRRLLELHPFESLYSRACRYFYSERLRRAFTFGSMYMGMSPFDAPATYSLLQYAELAEGIWYPRGGFHRVVDALVDVGRRLGVEYRLASSVARIEVDDKTGSASGVVLASGDKLSADVVVINADLVYAVNHLLPPSPRGPRLAARPASCSAISFYWAMSRLVLELGTHNVFLADDYRQSFDEIFKRHSMPRQPSFYVNVPSRIDRSAAPPGTDAIVVLVPVGHLLPPDEEEGRDWDSIIAEAREAVFATIEARTGATDLRDAIVKELVNSPHTWQHRFNLDRGAILGLSHSFFNVMSFRPPTKCPEVGNCYFVGASTHPGTGVPVCLAGSKIIAAQILSDFGIEEAGNVSETRSTVRKPIDRLDPPLMSRLHVVVFGLGLLFFYWLVVYIRLPNGYFSR